MKSIINYEKIHCSKYSVLFFLISFTLLNNHLHGQLPGTGIFFQAIARDNASNAAKDRKIYVQSNILKYTVNGISALNEAFETTTDATGVFSISLGLGKKIGGSAANLQSIIWAEGPYFLNLKIAVTPIAPITNWDYTKELIDLGTTPFGTVPYALYAGSSFGLSEKLNIADTSAMLNAYVKNQVIKTLEAAVSGKVASSDTSAMLAPYKKMVNQLIASNITSLTAASINEALNSKVNVADSILTYVTPSQLAAKTFDITPINTSLASKLNSIDTNAMLNDRFARDTISLSNRINQKANSTDVEASLALKVNSQDLINSLALKANSVDVANGLSLKANSTDLLNSLGLKANSNDVLTSLNLKVDKAIGKVLSSNDYTSLEKNKLAAITGINTGDQDLSAYATNTNLALKLNSSDTTGMLSSRFARDTASLSNRINQKANSADVETSLALKVNNTDLVNALGVKANTNDVETSLNSKVNNADLINALGLKANTSDVLDGLDLKVDKEMGKVLSSNDYSNAEKAKLAGITGINSGDQDLSTYATNANLALKLNSTDTSTMLNTRFARDTFALSNRINLKEDVFNKSLNVFIDGTLDSKYPSVKAVKTFVDNAIAAIPLASYSLVTAGLLSNTDWNIFNNKLSSFTETDPAVSAINGIIKSNGTLLSAAIAGADYLTPNGSASNLTNFPTFNQNTTGSAASLTAAYIDWNAINGGSSILNKPNLFSGSYNDLTSKPTLFSGAYHDLTGAPNLFSGSYSDLTDKPILNAGTVKSVSALTIGNSGTDVSSTVLNGTSTPTITLNIPTASITNRGLLSAADWSLFYSKGDMTLADAQTVTGTKTFSSTIVGSINGNAATASKLATPVTINGTSFDGSANISFSTNTVNSLAFNNAGTGDVSGATFNGAAAKTISYNTIGAAPTLGSTSIITLGSITTGTWNAATISVAKGGTGATTLTANGLLIGNGTSAVTALAPGTNGNILSSNGTTWVSSTPSITLIREIADEFSATSLQTSFTLSQTPSSNSKVKMYINGVRISNSAYSIIGTTLTYNATNNGAYSLTASDRIQFDYYY